MYPRSFLREEVKIKQHTSTKTDLCKICEEAIWESRFTYFLSFIIIIIIIIIIIWVEPYEKKIEKNLFVNYNINHIIDFFFDIYCIVKKKIKDIISFPSSSGEI